MPWAMCFCPFGGVLLKLLTHSPPAICFAYLLKK